MKRDMDLIRRILLEVEEQSDGTGVVRLQPGHHTPAEVSYHVKILHQAELIEARCSEGTRQEHWVPLALTWKGHEFLDNIRNDTVWKRVKDIVQSHTGSVSVSVLQSLALETVKKMVSSDL